MPEPEEERSEGSRPSRGDRAGEALRTAVERTLAATAGSAAETRHRARELLDEVARRGGAARDEVARRSDAARGDLARRGEEATSRIAEAIAELNLADRDDLGPISERIAAIERRLADLERLLRRERLGRADAEGESQSEVEGEETPGEADSGA